MCSNFTVFTQLTLLKLMWKLLYTQTNVIDSSECTVTQDTNDIKLSLMGVVPEETEVVKCEGKVFQLVQRHKGIKML